jgi:ABC-type transporter Mla subunit MlaD
MAGKLHIKHKELFVGTFVALALVILLWFMVQLMLKQDFFSATVNLKAFFRNTGNLAAGGKVCIKGIAVGRVDKVRLNDLNQIELDLSVKQKFIGKIRRDSRASIGRENPMMPISDPIVDILPGKPDQLPLKEGDTLLSGQELDLTALISAGTKIVTDVANGKGMVGQILTNDSLGPQLVRLMQNMETLLNQVNAIATRGEKIINEAGTALTTVRGLTEELKPVLAGLPPLMTKVDVLLSQAQPLPAETRALLEKGNNLLSLLTKEQGVLNQVMQDKEIYPQLRQIITKLDSLVTKIDHGKLKVNVDLY